MKNETWNVDHWVNNKHPNHLPVVWTPSSEQSKAVKEPGTGTGNTGRAEQSGAQELIVGTSAGGGAGPQLAEQ